MSCLTINASSLIWVRNHIVLIIIIFMLLPSAKIPPRASGTDHWMSCTDICKANGYTNAMVIFLSQAIFGTVDEVRTYSPICFGGSCLLACGQHCAALVPEVFFCHEERGERREERGERREEGRGERGERSGDRERSGESKPLVAGMGMSLSC